MILSRLLITAVLLALAGVAAAQPPKTPPPAPSAPGLPSVRPPMKWWQNAQWSRELGLAADQVARIEEIFSAARPKMRDGFRQLEPLEQQLSKMISGDGITEVDLLRQLDRIEAIRTELSKEQTLMLFRIRRVLMPEQRVKLAEMQSKHSDRGRGRPPQASRH